ncbi:hypothetical protein K402DRAFT_344863 [Aulographum hederae CBS 113979]|uniref:SWI/SNF chromatin remodeling complex component n=1 Tax=Aulographum hederae CBS 113979 TaxID=1176131 RepID=A0A6G1HHG1_9PEZI|nr:hypothetical protein K402DRAFT_344863 [Aulographum hederae CBS 113979]
MRLEREKKEAKLDEKLAKERQNDINADKNAVDAKFKALEYLLSQSQLYSTIMLSQMQKQDDADTANDEKSRKRQQKQEEKAEQVAEESQRRATRGNAGGAQPEAANSKKRGVGKSKNQSSREGKISSYFTKEDLQASAGGDSIPEALEKAAEADVKSGDMGIQNLRPARQPALVKGGTMRSYQLEGLEWLKSLYENGLNGILADEMGLGKTIQTISFLAFLRENESFGPFLIAAPLSTTSNWVAEFEKWTPDIPVVLYHGSKPEREEIRRKKLKKPGSPEFPVVVTSYEICMNDRKFLAAFGWKFIIIDEGHRLKNLNCRLIRELQTYQSANRLLITGTPLQNNLTELWSLLHFLMPLIFDKLESFESWFDFSALKEKNGYEQILNEERQGKLVASLHAILKPFLLRRVKMDVEKLMPKKREYVLFAPLTSMQRELYQAILDKRGRAFLEGQAEQRLGTGMSTLGSTRSKRNLSAVDGLDTPNNKSAKASRESTPGSMTRSTRAARGRRNYQEVSDREYFKQLEEEEDADEEPSTPPELDSEAEEEEIRVNSSKNAKLQIAAKKMQNPVMQLRLCCDSPFNFYNPFLDTEDQTADETLVTSSGKMLLLDSLLPELFAGGHKVLIFSQFKTQLDLLETYATELRGWNVCRIDGSVPQTERHAQITAFNKPAHDAIANLFLLSTRAGGQGINLVAADTVILFDSDWNPQQDLQAQDRAHRIGQTKNVIVYRFATRNTVEQRLLEGAEAKRRLEKLVIRKGGVSSSAAEGKKEKELLEELQNLLRRSDGERFDFEDMMKKGEGLISKRDMEILTDRSDEAYVRAEKGLDEGDVFKAVEAKKDGALLEGLKDLAV